jgi:hypothetical protein
MLTLAHILLDGTSCEVNQLFDMMNQFVGCRNDEQGNPVWDKANADLRDRYFCSYGEGWNRIRFK